VAAKGRGEQRQAARRGRVGGAQASGAAAKGRVEHRRAACQRRGGWERARRRRGRGSRGERRDGEAAVEAEASGVEVEGEVGKIECTRMQRVEGPNWGKGFSGKLNTAWYWR
jgi:hypothetical protein